MATPQAAPRPVSWNVVNDQQIMVTNDHEGTVNDFLEVLDDIPWPAAFTDQSDSHKQKEVSEDEYTLPLSERLTYIRHTEARTFLHGSTNAAVQKHLQEWRNARAEQRFVMFLQMHQYQTYDREAFVVDILKDVNNVFIALHTIHRFQSDPQWYLHCGVQAHSSDSRNTTTDVHLTYTSRQASALHVTAATMEGKRDVFLQKNACGIRACFNRSFAWPRKNRGALTNGEKIFVQIWNQMCRYRTNYAYIASTHLIYFCWRTIDAPNELKVDGPYWREPTQHIQMDEVVNSGTVKTSDIMCFLALACIVAAGTLIQEAEHQYELVRSLRVSDGIDIRSGPIKRWLRRAGQVLKRRWAEYRLAHCQQIILYSRDGIPLEPGKRIAKSLNVASSWLDPLFLIISSAYSWFAPTSVELRARDVSGRGASSTAWRMTWGGVSVIVKAPRHMRDQTLVKEWDNLKARLPVQSDVASRLPIPTYYGLFNLEDCIVMVTSDNGISLDQLNKPIDDVRGLFARAVYALRAAGIQPTDLSLRNTVWDGRHLTLIDFVDDTVTYSNDPFFALGHVDHSDNDLHDE